MQPEKPVKNKMNNTLTIIMRVKGNKIRYIDISNKRDTNTKMYRLRNRLKMKLYEKQNIEYSLIKNEGNITTNYNDLIKKVKDEKENLYGKSKEIMIDVKNGCASEIKKILK